MDLTDRRLLAGHIKYIRDVLGETFLQFAERLGVYITDVTAWEIATRRPGAEASAKLAEAAEAANLPKLAAVFRERAAAVAEHNRINQSAMKAAFPGLFGGDKR